MAKPETLNIGEDYIRKYGFYDTIQPVFQTGRGLSRRVVEEISYEKGEPKWMRDFRLRAYEIFISKPMPTWGPDLSGLNFDEIVYYIKPTDRKGRSWDEVPEEIKRTFDRLGIPEWERKFLAGVGAQYDCLTADAMVYTDSGLVPIAKIQPGQWVYSLDPESRRIIKQRVRGVMYKGKLPVFEVKVAGRTLKATYNHPFYAIVYEKGEGKQRGTIRPEWRYLSDLQAGDYIAIARRVPDEGKPYRLPEINLPATYRGRNQCGEFEVNASNWLYTRQQRHLRLPTETSEPLMWFLGAYLGDGCLRRKRRDKTYTIVDIAFPATQPEMRAQLADALCEAFHYRLRPSSDPYRVRIYSALIARFLETLGVTGNAYTKSLPDWVYSLPRSQQLALLAGYIDADGGVRCDERNNDVLLTSVNESLLKAMHRLAVRCGLNVSAIYTFTSKSTYKGQTTERTGYRFLISGDLTPLAEYSVKVRNNLAPRRYHHRYRSYNGSPLKAHTSEDIGFARIDSITYVGVEDTYDIEVEGVHNFIAEGIIVHNSEVIYHNLARQWEEKGVIFVDTDTAVREYPDLVREYFGTVIPPHDNKFAALNSAVWSGGSFVYVPAGVHVEIPLQAYFRINAKNAGQFERTLIIAEEGAFVHYVEGCTAPVYAEEALHSAVVEIIVKRGARVRYTTIQNWSRDVYNLVTKRAVVYGDAVMEWVDGNLGCVCAGELVYTERGPVPIEQVEPGTRVWSFDETRRLWVLRPVVARKDSGLQQVYEIALSNGRSLRLTANHPLLTVQYDAARPRKLGRYSLRWKPVEALQAGDLIIFPTALQAEGQPYRFARPSMPDQFTGRNQYGTEYAIASHSRQPVQLPEYADEDICWLLGLWMAEGDYTIQRGRDGHRYGRVGFSVPTTDRAYPRLISLLTRYFGNHAIELRKDERYLRVNSLEFALWLQANGFVSGAKEKRVPAWVFTLPTAMQAAFLAGYIDGDGCARGNRLSLKSANRALLQDVQQLALQCGVHASAVYSHTMEADINRTGRTKQYTAYRLDLANVAPLLPHLTPALRERLSTPKKARRHQRLRGFRTTHLLTPEMGIARIQAITPSIVAPTYDLEVAEAHSFVVNGVLVHNSRVTMKYPSVYLLEPGARGEVLSVAFAGDGQHQDTGGKAIHAAPYTSSRITSKSISKGTGRASYRGLVQVLEGAHHSKCNVECDALLLDENARTDTYPYIEVNEQQVTIGHEARVSKVSEEQLFYLRSRGLKKDEALTLIVSGFIEPLAKQLPMEYAVELNRLIELEMEGSVG
jgi:Fe-S cluster assembly scaffold protein SufB